MPSKIPRRRLRSCSLFRQRSLSISSRQARGIAKRHCEKGRHQPTCHSQRVIKSWWDAGWFKMPVEGFPFVLSYGDDERLQEDELQGEMKHLACCVIVRRCRQCQT
eukprot:scaffold38788_cov221-Amphora_coffeaeformis.AAC.5